MEPKVSIILVNYNGEKDTCECIKSLKKITYTNYEIIVVDNASQNQEYVESLLPKDVIFIKSQDNLGFSGGNNLGIHYAINHGSDYVILLNNDTVVEKEFVIELLKTAQKKDDAGIITGKILYYSKPEYIWYAGGYMNLNRARIHHLHIREKEDTNDICEKSVSFATGCLMMMSKEVIEKVGVLDDAFFMYAEDAEYCARIRNAGYKIWYNPKAKIFHKVSASSGGAGSKLSQYYRTRNELYLVLHFANHKLMGMVWYYVRLIKRLVTGQYSMHYVIAGLSDYYTGKMGKTSRILKSKRKRSWIKK